MWWLGGASGLQCGRQDRGLERHLSGEGHWLLLSNPWVIASTHRAPHNHLSLQFGGSGAHADKTPMHIKELKRKLG